MLLPNSFYCLLGKCQSYFLSKYGISAIYIKHNKILYKYFIVSPYDYCIINYLNPLNTYTIVYIIMLIKLKLSFTFV